MFGSSNCYFGLLLPAACVTCVQLSHREISLLVGYSNQIQITMKKSKPTRQKKLSAATAVCLGILSDYPDGMTLDDAVAGYEQMNLECERRAVCTYLHRVKKLGFIETKGVNANTTYHMTKAGQRELAWWRALVG